MRGAAGYGPHTERWAAGKSACTASAAREATFTSATRARSAARSRSSPTPVLTYVTENPDGLAIRGELYPSVSPSAAEMATGDWKEARVCFCGLEDALIIDEQGPSSIGLNSE